MASPAQPKLAVLYADDDLDDQQFVRSVLKLYVPNLKLITVDNGVEALNFLKKLNELDVQLCLIILDINMPLMDGKETLLELKQIPAAKNIPVVLFSTSSQPGERKFANDNGAGFITKPIDQNQVNFLADAFIEHCSDEIKGQLTKK